MPVMDGFEATHSILKLYEDGKICSDPKISQMPSIICLTAYVSDEVK
jgi:CheY-like chemotaxis protein